MTLSSPPSKPAGPRGLLARWRGNLALDVTLALVPLLVATGIFADALRAPKPTPPALVFSARG